MCTKEACQFNDNVAGFQASGVPVIGVSPDDAVMDAWGAWGEKKRYGRTSVGVLRSTFLLDAHGRVDRAWHNVTADGHATSVLNALQT